MDNFEHIKQQKNLLKQTPPKKKHLWIGIITAFIVLISGGGLFLLNNYINNERQIDERTRETDQVESFGVTEGQQRLEGQQTIGDGTEEFDQGFSNPYSGSLIEYPSALVELYDVSTSKERATKIEHKLTLKNKACSDTLPHKCPIFMQVTGERLDPEQSSEEMIAAYFHTPSFIRLQDMYAVKETTLGTGYGYGIHNGKGYLVHEWVQSYGICHFVTTNGYFVTDIQRGAVGLAIDNCKEDKLFNSILSTLIFLTPGTGIEIILYGKIDSTTKIIYVSKETDERHFDPGQIILDRNGERNILEDNILLGSAGGFSHRIYETNYPNVIELTYNDGDLGGWISTRRFLDLKNEKVELMLSTGSNDKLMISKNSIGSEIGIFISGSCGERGEREGKHVLIEDLTLNGSTQNVLEESISVNCVDGDFGLAYDPGVGFEILGTSRDYQKIYFRLKGKRLENRVENIVWTKDFLFSTDTKQITPLSEIPDDTSFIKRGQEIFIQNPTTAGRG